MTQTLQTKVAIYSRVSTFDKGQDPENQLAQLRDYCKREGYEIVAEYIDHQSGRKSGNDRAEFRAMFEAASQKRFDLVLFWSLDRLSREGIAKTIHYLQLLDGYGVTFKSFTEPYLDSGNELVKHILLGVMAYLAKQEAVKISERTKAGLERARRQGRRGGRPPLPDKRKRKIIAKWLELGSMKATARELDEANSTVRKVVGEYKAYERENSV